MKFGAVRRGPGAEERFAALLDACAGLAHEAGMPNVLAGVNLARRNLSAGVRPALPHDNSACHDAPAHEPGYSAPGLFVLDDWR